MVAACVAAGSRVGGALCRDAAVGQPLFGRGRAAPPSGRAAHDARARRPACRRRLHHLINTAPDAGCIFILNLATCGSITGHRLPSGSQYPPASRHELSAVTLRDLDLRPWDWHRCAQQTTWRPRGNRKRWYLTSERRRLYRQQARHSTQCFLENRW